MAKDRNRGGMSVVDKPADSNAVETAQAQATDQVAAAAAVTVNRVLTYRRDHPGDRCSYGIAGVSGIVVFDKGLFLDGVAPAIITVDCDLALPKPDGKAEKARLAAERAAEKAAKAAQKIEQATARAAEKKQKAEEALRKAQERAASLAGSAPAASTPAQS